MRIVDTVMVFNELDLLKVRLSEHYDHVDKIIITEAERTHSNKPKEMYFADSKSEFVEWMDKIEHVIVPAEAFKECEFPLPQKQAWFNEHTQRFWWWMNNHIEADWVLSADCDEIIKGECFDDLKAWLGNCKRLNVAINLDLYYFYINTLNSKPWSTTRLFRARNPFPHCNHPTWPAQKLLRHKGILYPPIIGWHFSYLGGLDAVQTKMDASCEYRRTAKINSAEWIAHVMNSNLDISGKGKATQLSGVRHLPEYMLDNWDVYGEYFKP